MSADRLINKCCNMLNHKYKSLSEQKYWLYCLLLSKDKHQRRAWGQDPVRHSSAIKLYRNSAWTFFQGMKCADECEPTRFEMQRKTVLCDVSMYAVFQKRKLGVAGMGCSWPTFRWSKMAFLKSGFSNRIFWLKNFARRKAACGNRNVGPWQSVPTPRCCWLLKKCMRNKQVLRVNFYELQ